VVRLHAALLLCFFLRSPPKSKPPLLCSALQWNEAEQATATPTAGRQAGVKVKWSGGVVCDWLEESAVQRGGLSSF
jgi:hypothetical protein